MLLEELVSIGFERKEAQKLAESNGFHHRRKTRQELTDLFNKISGVYDCTFEDVKKAVLNFPPFAGLDHERVVRKGIEVYGAGNEDKVKRAILIHSPFAGYDHERVVRKGIEVYGAGNEDKVKRAILIHSPFAGYDHERVVRKGIEVYGAGNEDKVKRAVLSFSPFAGYDHERVVRQKTRLGRMAGLSDEETVDYLLDLPVLAGYSAKRYLAAFDIGRQLEKEGFPQDERMLKAFFSYFGKSPYIPDSNRKRISQVVSDKEPSLLKAMRQMLTKSS